MKENKLKNESQSTRDKIVKILLKRKQESHQLDMVEDQIVCEKIRSDLEALLLTSLLIFRGSNFEFENLYGDMEFVFQDMINIYIDNVVGKRAANQSDLAETIKPSEIFENQEELDSTIKEIEGTKSTIRDV